MNYIKKIICICIYFTYIINIFQANINIIIIILNNKKLIINEVNVILFCFSLEYQKELIPCFNAQPIYALLAEYMFCDKEKLVKQVNNLVDSEEAKITKLIEK